MYSCGLVGVLAVTWCATRRLRAASALQGGPPQGARGAKCSVCNNFNIYVYIYISNILEHNNNIYIHIYLYIFETNNI